MSGKPVKYYEEVRVCLPDYRNSILSSNSPDTVVANHVKWNFSHAELPHFKVQLKKHADSSYGIFIRRGLLVNRFHLTDGGFILENRSEVSIKSISSYSQTSIQTMLCSIMFLMLVIIPYTALLMSD